MTTTNYAWRVYGDGGPDNPSCQMVAYRTDPDRTPSKWQETLDGKEKRDAMVLVEQDRWAAEQIPNGEGYTQTAINKDSNWYLRTSKETGNSWEVILDEDSIELPNPCVGATPPPDPRDSKVSLERCVITTQYQGQAFTMSVKGTAIPPTA